MKKIKTSTKSKKSGFFRRLLPYVLIFGGIMALVVVGSIDKNRTTEDGLNMQSIIANDSSVSADQLSEFYMVADVASAMDLATASVINTNYDSVSIMQETGQNKLEKATKPSIIDTSHLSRGVVTHVVAEGETMDSIAGQYGITTTQIRWSNNLKTNNISVGQSLLIPTIPGISYTVKNGDTIEGLAAKYNSSAEQIIAYNDLEEGGVLTPGSIIILPSGELPEAERPEYNVRGGTRAGASSYAYTAQMASGNKYAYGWCTWFAWQWRNDNMGGNYGLPGNLGNAYLWASRAASAGYVVNKTPAYGAVFQTGAGYYGHVGIVTGVNSDGTITITDMNGIAGWGRVGTTTVDRSTWQSYNFIHQHY